MTEIKKGCPTFRSRWSMGSRIARASYRCTFSHPDSHLNRSFSFGENQFVLFPVVFDQCDPRKNRGGRRAAQKVVRTCNRSRGSQPRTLHSRFASPGAPVAIFEQEGKTLGELDGQIAQLTESPYDQLWTKSMSGLLRQSLKRAVYLAARK
jgi:hypothetical protein